MGRLPMIGAVCKSIMGLSSVALLLQTAAPAVPSDPLTSVGRLSVEVCLITAVGVLWKALEKKDKAKDDAVARKDEAIDAKTQQLLALIDRMVGTMTLVIEGDKEVRGGMAVLLSKLSSHQDK